MELNRADMKLLTEAGYSAVMRHIDVDPTPIFEALEAWLPEYGAGMTGLALQAIIRGDFAAAEALLERVVAEKKYGGAEARALLVMCKTIQKDEAAAIEAASQLRGAGGAAEDFARLLVEGVGERARREREHAGSPPSEAP